ncbi:GNAT family N-acetyltransferase [Phenylobacterium sp. LjRoot225]|uniref:GNAT family N-acetyltransferase n=1 Tax=Phenylobacterium sp. LjRoot225 TaxID=3342285 RepID=UPI003ECF9CBB
MTPPSRTPPSRPGADHPLDRAVWAALTTRQADLTLGEGRARRLAPDYGLFTAAADGSDESLGALASLIRAHGEAALFEADPPRELAGVAITPGDPVSQMIAEAPVLQSPDFEVLALGDADAAEMLALATLTKPGPFFRRTHRLGDFVGVRVDGRLAAMAGERLRLPGYTEVSAVCTHPDFRGRGYAAGLMAVVTEAIVARGETAFLHVYDHNESAIRLYETLGWRRRGAMTVSFVQAA